ncbi:hypothetical protein BUALT_Bualt06G0003800 [Buddleja alternifolia]|uniref:Lipoyl-binding domain-containing protein n=1 Tax=Buddleja alternifolia TaxID=168488 RepID=A0AAV6XBT5_9LAMI|nr:hypothetical protein BUALT_Bualt06G0003800 [Buddleja alternifolia]
MGVVSESQNPVMVQQVALMEENLVCVPISEGVSRRSSRGGNVSGGCRGRKRRNQNSGLALGRRGKRMLNMIDSDSKLRAENTGNPGAAGAGGIFRDHLGEFIFAFSMNLGMNSNNFAEMWAAFEGRRLKGEGTSTSNADHNIQLWIMWSNMENVCLAFGYRKGNQAADHLDKEGAAHFGIKKYLECPTSLESILYKNNLCSTGRMAKDNISMATSFGAAVTGKSSTYLPVAHRHFFLRSPHSNKLSFRLASKPKLRFSSKPKLRFSSSSSKGLQSGWNCSAVVRAQSNEVSVAKDKNVNLSKEPSPTSLASEESISEFITQVSSLVKLVDSKDIVELHLEQLDCEILIRKKEALPPPPSAPMTYVQSLPQPASPPPVPTPSPVSTAAPSPAPTPAPSPPKPQPSKSSHPPLKCPMAGTFYRSPGPGEPPFVKIGDKVQKGQVICIIEAMKLMNEIEADQSGTIVEIIAEDGKPVSVDTPLFVIEP